MFIAYLAVTAVTIVLNAGAAVLDFMRAEYVLGNVSTLRLPESWLPMLGALKAAGAAGLLLGLLGVPLIGVAAAAGLVLFFVGALVAHFRARAFHRISVPVGILGLAIASLALAVAQ